MERDLISADDLIGKILCNHLQPTNHVLSKHEQLNNPAGCDAFSGRATIKIGPELRTEKAIDYGWVRALFPRHHCRHCGLAPPLIWLTTDCSLDS